jgi:CHAT domain-containing protein
LILTPPRGETVGRRVELSHQELVAALHSLYAQISRQDPLDVGNPLAPARQLYSLLIEPIEPELRARGINNLLIAADPGLQAVPFAALHDGIGYFGLRFGFSLTPSLALTSFVPMKSSQVRNIALGASTFQGLAPLPLVPQEAQTAASNQLVNLYLGQAFTVDRLIAQAGNPSVKRVHIATHAEFLPGGPEQARLFTGVGPMSLKQFAELRARRQDQPLDLIALSACRTALGDTNSELGFAGLAIQSGARSAIGTLWYVDDVATSAYFVLLYRLLDAGWKKSEALQEVRRAFAQGEVRLQGDAVVLADGTRLIEKLTPTQQRRVASGLQHPFFWSGIELLGTPW